FIVVFSSYFVRLQSVSPVSTARLDSGTLPHGFSLGLQDVERVRLRADLLPRVAEHDHAERAGKTHRGRSGVLDLLHPGLVDPGTQLLLHPHPPAAGSTTEPPFAGSRKLLDLESRDRPEQVAGRRVDPVVPAEVAGVVVRDRLPHRLGQ